MDEYNREVAKITQVYVMITQDSRNITSDNNNQTKTKT